MDYYKTKGEQESQFTFTKAVEPGKAVAQSSHPADHLDDDPLSDMIVKDSAMFATFLYKNSDSFIIDDYEKRVSRVLGNQSLEPVTEEFEIERQLSKPNEIRKLETQFHFYQGYNEHPLSVVQQYLQSMESLH